MFVFAPTLSELQSNHYDRDIITYQDGTQSLSPNTHVITTNDFIDLIFYELIKSIYENNYQSFKNSKELNEIIKIFKILIERKNFLSLINQLKLNIHKFKTHF